MKNLKRVLSLALSGIMLVGMMAMSASAVNAEDFTDADEITHTEAVSISTALKIIDGKEDGSFDPDGYVTRGQMAKMITRAMFGGEDPVLGLPGTPTFSDIKGRWDESYIEYCSNNGIINGRGDGTFDPEGNVTGTEAAKMLLTALGYKADIYGLVGPDWAITTNSIANQTKVALYAGLKGLDPTQPFTRDQVAQMIYNALNANTREMNPTMEITGKGDITYQYTDSGRTLLYDKYGAVRVEGVVTDNEFANNADAQKGKTQITITNADEINALLGLTRASLSDGDIFNMEVSSGKDEYGRAVIIYAKPANSAPASLGRATVISDVIVDADLNVVHTTTGGFKNLADWADDKGMKLEATGTSTVNATVYKVNYDGAAAVVNAAPGTATGGFGATEEDFSAKRGTEVIMIDNDSDGYADYVLRNNYTFGQVTKYSTKDDGAITIRTNGGATLAPSNEKLKNVVAYEDIAQDDYVNVTKVHNTYYVTKSETVDGSLTAYENETKYSDGENEIYVNKTKSLTVDDEAYKTNQLTAAYTSGGLKAIDDIAKNSVLTEDVTVYLDTFGYAVAGNTKAAADFLFVANAAVNDQATGLSSATLTAFVYMEDGTSGSYVVDKYTLSDGTVADRFDTGSGHPNKIKGKLFKYTVKSNGHLVLEGADTLNNDTSANRDKSNEVVVNNTGAAGKGIIYDRELSKLTIDNNGNSRVDSDEPVKYVTMDTVVFFVSLKANGQIDKVQVYDQKTAPSMNYANEATTALWNNTKFLCGASYFTTADSSFDLDALVFTSTQAVSSDWLFLIDYVRTVDDGRIYNAIVDGEVKQIVTNDKKVRSVPNAFGYAMDGNLYDLDDGTYNMALIGEVTLIDRKSVIVDDGGNGVEAKITANTLTAYLDSDDTQLDAAVSKGDVVCLIRDENNNAEGIYIIKEFDDATSSIVYTDPSITTDGTNAYKMSIPANTTTVGAIKAAFAVSGGADVVVLAAEPAKDTDGKYTATVGTMKTAAQNDSTSVVAGTAQWMVVISESVKKDSTATKGYSVYKVTPVTKIVGTLSSFAKVNTIGEDNQAGGKGGAAKALVVDTTKKYTEGIITAGDVDNTPLFTYGIFNQASGAGSIGDDQSDEFYIATLKIDGSAGKSYQVNRWSDSMDGSSAAAWAPSGTMPAGEDFEIALILGNKMDAYFKITINGSDVYQFTWDAPNA